jgi:hypothetical protein
MHDYKKSARWVACLAMALAAGLTQAATLSLDVTGAAGATVTTSTTSATGTTTPANDRTHTPRKVYHLSEAQLLALPAHSITTSTAWTPRATFTGPLLADILKAVGVHGSQIEVHTFDDYIETIPVSDCNRYGVIVAYSMNGKRLKVSDFGPLFLIYPRDTFPTELSGADADSKFVWQIKGLIVK